MSPSGQARPPVFEFQSSRSSSLHYLESRYPERHADLDSKQFSSSTSKTTALRDPPTLSKGCGRKTPFLVFPNLDEGARTRTNGIAPRDGTSNGANLEGQVGTEPPPSPRTRTRTPNPRENNYRLSKSGRIECMYALDRHGRHTTQSRILHRDQSAIPIQITIPCVLALALNSLAERLDRRHTAPWGKRRIGSHEQGPLGPSEKL